MQPQPTNLKRRSDSFDQDEETKKMKLAERKQIKLELAEEARRADQLKTENTSGVSESEETDPPPSPVPVPVAPLQNLTIPQLPVLQSPMPSSPFSNGFSPKAIVGSPQAVIHHHQQRWAHYNEQYRSMTTWWEQQCREMRQSWQFYERKLQYHGEMIREQQMHLRQLQPQHGHFQMQQQQSCVYIPPSGHPSWFC